MKHRASVLLAEDDAAARAALRDLLTDDGYDVLPAADGDEALRLLSAGGVEAALLDVRMPGVDGIDVLRAAKAQPDPPAVLVMTAYGNSSIAIEAMKLGAYDYIAKPVNFTELSILLQRAIESRRRTLELAAYRHDSESSEPEMAGNSAAMQRVYKLIGQVASLDSTVLVRGESGTGKELVARAIHTHSPRRDRRLVKVNCAAIPEGILEAELFGYERGAFTGATQRRFGKFEHANGGTIFLDEIGDLSPGTQIKLLRVLQERSIERLGSNATITLDIRVIAATTRDLEEAVRKGDFREDLYYRLNVFTILLPPLRERTEDTPVLARALLRRASMRLRRSEPPVSDDCMALLQSRPWPGNVRELEHALERALVLHRGGALASADFSEATPPVEAGDPFARIPLEAGYHETISRLERSLVERALQSSGGNRTKAAELLKINRRLLYDKLREFRIE
jgi:DNA-binding NtrC family response regulator